MKIDRRNDGRILVCPNDDNYRQAVEVDKDDEGVWISAPQIIHLTPEHAAAFAAALDEAVRIARELVGELPAPNPADEFARMLAMRESSLYRGGYAEDDGGGWRGAINSDCAEAVDYLVSRGLAERREGNPAWFRLLQPEDT